MYIVYILQCRDESYCIGSTDDLIGRLKRHNNGTASIWTKNRLPVKLVCEEKFSTRAEAMKRERQIKNGLERKKRNSSLVSGHKYGEVAERLNATVLKTVRVNSPRGFESLPLRQRKYPSFAGIFSLVDGMPIPTTLE